jgi:hypothetical protein
VRHLPEGRRKILTLERAVQFSVYDGPSFRALQMLLNFRFVQFLRSHDFHLPKDPARQAPLCVLSHSAATILRRAARPPPIERSADFQYAYCFATCDFPPCAAALSYAEWRTLVKKKVRAIQYGIGPIGA